MFIKFFTLRILNRDTGRSRRATFRERIKWLKEGRPLHNKKVIDRFCYWKAKKSNVTVG